MHRAQTNTEHGIGTASGGDTRTATIIGVSLMGALVVLFLLSTVFGTGEGGGGTTPTLQTVPEDTSGVDTLPGIETTSFFQLKPRFWLQARALSTGNAGWGPDVVAPFDTLWQLESSGGREFFSSPALVDGTLYLGCNDGRIRAVDASSGSVLWSYSTVCGICGEPAVDSAAVYFGGQDGYIYSLDRSSGSRNWSSGIGYHVFCDTGIMCDSLIISGNSMGKVCALDSRSGEPVWDAELGGIILGPVIIDTLAVFTTESGVTAVLDSNGRVRWDRSDGRQASPPSADSTAVFVGFSGGMVRKFDLDTGDLVWETDVVSGSGRCVLARPVVTGSRVLVGTNDGQLVCLDRQGGGVLWAQQFDNWLQLSPAVGQDLVYLACDDQRLHILELETGEKVDSLEMGGYSGTAPLLWEGTLFYGNTSGDFRAIRGTLPEEEQTGVQPDTTGESAQGTDTLTVSADTLDTPSSGTSGGDMVQALPEVPDIVEEDVPDSVDSVPPDTTGASQDGPDGEEGQ